MAPVRRPPAPKAPARPAKPPRRAPRKPKGAAGRPAAQSPRGAKSKPRPRGAATAKKPAGRAPAGAAPGTRGPALDRANPPKKKKLDRPAGPATPGAPGTERFRDLRDPAAMKDDRGKVTATRQPGQPFAAGVDPRDVEQGAIGDCYFCAGLSSVAQAQPGVLKDGITDNGDGTYGVRLYDRSGKAHTVTVDDELYRKKNGGPRYARGTDRKELWPALYEKAYAQFRGNYETIGDGGQARKAMQTITGKPSDRVSNRSLSQDGLWNRINGALDNKRPIATDTFGNEKKYTKSGIVDGHAYSVLGTQEKGDDRFVVLRNPWGATEYANSDYGTDVDFDNDGKMDGNDGVFRMKLDDFHRLFEHTDVNDVPKKPGMLSRFMGLFGG